MKYMKYTSIPCKHERGEADNDTVVDDYHPLTDKQIIGLLTEALTSYNPSSQQVRLMQAIPGMKCPRQLDNFEKEGELFDCFVKGLERGWWTGEEITKILTICNG